MTRYPHSDESIKRFPVNLLELLPLTSQGVASLSLHICILQVALITALLNTKDQHQFISNPGAKNLIMGWKIAPSSGCFNDVFW
ncbi:hypothetical protein TNCT_586231 [Trichonephila clavata]|uniref:Uncharacterized protein n=1 Tax=Trichonephila clavata TaxID=2740835 RepID=A0A8X6J1Y8_TRICU|nr:hypothetical protein TNCT_586231 [Trichonephila clavata]